MTGKQNAAIVVIMALALTLGAAQLVTSIGQVAYAGKIGNDGGNNLIRSPLPPGLKASPLPPGFILSK
jgi:hypothetical protein